MNKTKNYNPNSIKIANRIKELVNAGQKVSCSEICREFECSYQTVYNVAMRDGINIPEHNAKLKKEENLVIVEEAPKAKTPKFKINEKYTNAFQIEKREEIWSKEKTQTQKTGTTPVEIKVIPVKKEIIKEKEVSETICGEPVFEYNSDIKPYVFAGLISQRHDTIDENTKLFVFNGPIRSEHVHDYKRFNELADKFIKDNVLAKGLNKLKVAVTGLTPAVAAVIKASYENNISLSLMHHDSLTGKYHEQIIIGSDESINDDLSLLQVFAVDAIKKNFKLKLVSFPAEDYADLKTIYVIKCENLSNKGDNSRIAYITFDMDTMFEIYKDLTKKIMTIKFESYRISADEIGFGITNREFCYKNSFGYYYNMPKPN